MKTKIPGGLTTAERKAVLVQLYGSHWNRDVDIAERLKLTLWRVTQYTSWHSSKRMKSFRKRHL